MPHVALRDLDRIEGDAQVSVISTLRHRHEVNKIDQGRTLVHCRPIINNGYDRLRPLDAMRQTDKAGSPVTLSLGSWCPNRHNFDGRANAGPHCDRSSRSPTANARAGRKDASSPALNGSPENSGLSSSSSSQSSFSSL